MTVLRCYCPVLALLLAHSYTAPHLAKSSLAAFIIISTLQLFFGTGIASFYGIWIHLQICSRIRSLFHVEIPSFVFLYAKSELAIEKEVDHCRAGSNHGGYGWNALFLRRSHRCTMVWEGSKMRQNCFELILTDHIACLFSSPDSGQFKSKIGINRYSPCQKIYEAKIDVLMRNTTFIP